MNRYFRHYIRLISTALLAACAIALSLPAHAQASSGGPVASGTSPAPVVQSAVASGIPSNKPVAPLVENPYGLEALWHGSDNIARAVLLLLAIMSVGSWYILATKLVHQMKMRGHARTAAQKFWEAETVTAGAGRLEANSAYRFIAEAAVTAVSDQPGLRRHIPVTEWIPMCISGAVERVQASSQAGFAFLATVGSTSPFVGLFGTVWGIYHALTAIGLSGQASIDKVAGPVGEALVMTAIGLAVAIPAVLGYNWVVRRNKAVMDEVREFADELNALVLGSAGKAA